MSGVHTKRLEWYSELDANGRRAFWTSFVGFGLDSMSIQLFAFVLPNLLSLWHLSPARAGVLASVSLASSAVGGWAAGTLSDRWGRVRVLRVTIVCLLVATCLCGLASTFDQLLFARALQGLGFGADAAVTAVFVNEAASAKSRGRMAGTAQSGWAIGWGVAAVTVLLAEQLPPAYAWRLAFFLGVPPALAILIARLRLEDHHARRAPLNPRSFLGIFAPRLARSTIGGTVLAIGMHGGYWAIAAWWPTYLRVERGMSAEGATIQSAVLIAGSFAGYLVGARISDRSGRRAALSLFAVGGSATLLCCTAILQYPAATLALSFPLGFFMIGIFSIIGAVLAELYPTELRGSGLGFCYNVGRGIAAMFPLLIGLSTSRIGIGPAIALYVLSSCILVLIAVLLLPETRGRLLDQSA